LRAGIGRLGGAEHQIIFPRCDNHRAKERWIRLPCSAPDEASGFARTDSIASFLP